MLQFIREFCTDRKGGPLQQAIIWACVLGGFYFAWTKWIGPSFMGTAQKQSNVLNESGSTYYGDAVPTN